jgi:probable phosphoglycerate mutase
VSPRSTLLLARHGETDWNREGRWQGATDIPLNDVGRAQARALAARLAERKIRAVASSDLSRARETAEIVAIAIGAPHVGALRDLRERSYGAFEGLTREECRAKFPDAFGGKDPSAFVAPLDAEPNADVGARMMRGLTTLMATHAIADHAVVAVAHGGAIRMFLDAAFAAKVPPLGNGDTFAITWETSRFVAFEKL